MRGSAPRQDSRAEGAGEDLRALRRDFGGEYDITLIGLTWYAWRHGVRSEPLRAGAAAELREKIRQDQGRPRPPVPCQRQDAAWRDPGEIDADAVRRLAAACLAGHPGWSDEEIIRCLALPYPGHHPAGLAAVLRAALAAARRDQDAPDGRHP